MSQVYKRPNKWLGLFSVYKSISEPFDRNPKIFEQTAARRATAINSNQGKRTRKKEPRQRMIGMHGPNSNQTFQANSQ